MIFRISLLCLCLRTLDTAKAELHSSLDQEGQQQLPADRDTDNFLETMSGGSQEQQTQPRSLEQPCPLGELWEAVSNKCVPNSCDSPQACPEYDETCRYSRRFCYDQTKVCGQFVCDSACPQYERLDPVTMECIPVSCASLNACPNPDVTGRSCLRVVNTDCEAGRPCPQFRCCPDISRCSSLYCAFGNVKDADGCPMCDCNACYGPFAAWGGGGGDYLVAPGGGSGKNRESKSMKRRRNTAAMEIDEDNDVMIYHDHHEPQQQLQKQNKHRRVRGERQQQQQKQQHNEDDLSNNRELQHYCPNGHEVNSEGCPMNSCRQTPWQD